MKEKAKESESERAPRTERSTNEGENKRDSEEERAWWGKSGTGAEWGKGRMRSYCLNRYKVSIREDENLETDEGLAAQPVSILTTT